MESVESQLKEYLNTGKDWEQMNTPISGVFIVKTPATKNRPARLFLEINPQNDGRSVKKKGLFINTIKNLDLFIRLLTNESIKKILSHIENVNSQFEIPEKKKKLIIEF